MDDYSGRIFHGPGGPFGRISFVKNAEAFACARYTHLIGFPSDEYDVQVAETLDDAKKLIKAGFDYVTDIDGGKIFRRRK